MKHLERAIDYLEKHDSSWDYKGVLEDFNNGHITLAEAEGECLRVLEGWRRNFSEEEPEYKELDSIISGF